MSKTNLYLLPKKFENRRHGISFSSIGKKLDIDNTKEEVVNVYTVMKDYDPSLPHMEDIENTTLKTYPTPLWFLFNSELELIAKESVPDPSSTM